MLEAWRVREWAIRAGYPVQMTGAVPKQIVALYVAAHPEVRS